MNKNIQRAFSIRRNQKGNRYYCYIFFTVMSAKVIFQLYKVSSGASKVAAETVKLASENCSIISSLRGNNELFAEAKFKSEEARAKAEKREINYSNLEASNEAHSGSEDIFKLAREKAGEAKIKKEDSQPNEILTAPKRAAPKKSKISNKREFHTSRFFLEDEKPKKIIGEAEKPEFEMTPSEVPSSRLSRLFHYGTLAAGVGLNVLSEGAKSYAQTRTAPSWGSLIMSPNNIERMAKKFSRMRGAALKVGQMLSFQDASVLPAEIQQILLRVQNSAHYMPASQLEKTMSFELGDGWRKRLFASFTDVPFAAASIGQVHRAVAKKDLAEVVVKVQYPGVADSIDSDLDNILTLLTASRLLPPGLFLDKSVGNARVELKWECDYIREARNLVTFAELLKDDPAFVVPKVFHELSDEHVLTMEYMKGKEIVKGDWDQETKNYIASNVMRLCLMEISQFKFMQTDPNWANFLYNAETHKIELLDFGACREFSSEFIDNYVNCLRAAIRKDRKACEEYSKKLGFLTGLESESMITAHVDSIIALGEPFSPEDNHGKPFDFTSQTVTDRVRGNISLMLNERLTPPPEETYSLHRKLSGAYLLCARMNATVDCQKIFDEVVGFEERK